MFFPEIVSRLDLQQLLSSKVGPKVVYNDENSTSIQEKERKPPSTLKPKSNKGIFIKLLETRPSSPSLLLICHQNGE